ncbi:Hypothetical protein SRAE_2000152600 [Strongyloides ratti]|uniref:Uncharacterized protein n=1 Tax=Strongyloides ratti TaxID=34506 RepID=A0A090LHA3_STRRB|nr:Hypothetical protein SRAE_2000152600 [Strongyloides ratti]CEF66860.1 Hypothetical protein SRAE_2000152600 [Strongyloides ratti]
MSDSKKNVKDDLYTSFYEMSIKTYGEISQKSTQDKKKEEEILKHIFNERQFRRKSIKPGPPIYFSINEKNLINKFYDDLLDYIKQRKRQPVYIYKTFITSLKLYCTQGNIENDGNFYIEFSKEWLKDIKKIKNFFDNCILSCDEKNLVYETIVLLHLYFTSLDLRNFDLDTIIGLLQCVYFNSQDDRVFNFLNNTICDEFFLFIPDVIYTIYKGMNFQSYPLDVEHYSKSNAMAFWIKQKYEDDCKFSFSNGINKPIIFNRKNIFIKQNEKVNKINQIEKNIKINDNKIEESRYQIGKKKSLCFEEKVRAKKYRKKKLEELLLSCGDESSSNYSTSCLLKISEKKKNEKKEKLKKLSPINLEVLENEIKEKNFNIISEIEENDIYFDKNKEKVLVPGTPEKILMERNLYNKIKYYSSDNLSLNNNYGDFDELVPETDNEYIDQLSSSGGRNNYFNIDSDREIQARKRVSCDIVSETPPYKIKCRKISKESSGILRLVKKNLFKKFEDEPISNSL